MSAALPRETPCFSAEELEAVRLEAVDNLLGALRYELLRACDKHRPMHSGHEGYAVILEELDELWDEIKANRPSEAAAIGEALQVAAMALRYILDVGQRTP